MSQPANLIPTELRETTNIDRQCMATQVRPIAHSSSSNDSYQPQFSRTSSVPPQGSAPAAHDEFPSKPKHDRASFPDARGVDNLEKASPSRDMKTATLNIAEHSQTELLAMLSALLTKITTSNDKLHTRSDAPNPSTHGTPYLAFHAQNVPVISIHSYLTRILKYCPMSSDIFLSLLVYFDRMSKNPLSDQSDHGSRQMFTSTRLYLGDEHHPFAIDSYNIHRLVITAIVVASKFCSDVFYTNSRYAKVSSQ